MTFWINDYTVLFKKEELQFWIHDTMTTDEKLNTITRIVILMTVGGFIMTQALNLIWIGLVTLIAIVLYQRTLGGKEMFSQLMTSKTEPTQKNPLMNVLLPEINGDPRRAPAERYNEETHEKIMDSVKEMLDPRIYAGKNNEMELEYSMRNFYTTASTTVPNDQKGFSEFCYGNMTSQKDGTNKI